MRGKQIQVKTQSKDTNTTPFLANALINMRSPSPWKLYTPEKTEEKKQIDCSQRGEWEIILQEKEKKYRGVKKVQEKIKKFAVMKKKLVMDRKSVKQIQTINPQFRRSNPFRFLNTLMETLPNRITHSEIMNDAMVHEIKWDENSLEEKNLSDPTQIRKCRIAFMIWIFQQKKEQTSNISEENQRKNVVHISNSEIKKTSFQSASF